MKKVLFIFLCLFISSISGVLAANYLYHANEVSYTSKNKEWQVDNVEDAINDLYEKIDFKSVVRLETSGPGGSGPAWMYRSYPNDYKVLIIHRWHGSGTPKCTYNGVSLTNYGIGYEGVYFIFDYKANTQIATFGDHNASSYRAEYLRR